MLHIVLEDAHLLVINKATGVLSQPGKTRDGSVLTEVRQNFPDARGPLLVHRLDMDTSGLLLLAKTRDAHRQLQQQFEKRLVQKRYTALLAQKPAAQGGVINLPLRKNWEQRPKQCVCFKSGKPSITGWNISADQTSTATVASACRIHLYPRTGRTHQLRVHTAEALGQPILGDRLYGTPGMRLMLHADRISFIHPHSGKRLCVSVRASF